MMMTTSGRRKDAFLDQSFAECDSVFVVDVKQGDGDAADRREADQNRTVPAEMRGPFVAAGIEEPGESAGFPVQAGQVGTFKRIAEGANVKPMKLTDIDPFRRFR